MRRKIAEHMVASRRTSAHVHTLFEVDFSEVMRIRDAARADAEPSGGKLTVLAFIAKAVVETLRDMPILNASVQGDQIIYKRDINLAIAVALAWGLIVPVIKHADQKSVRELAAATADLAERARAKRLSVDEVEGGTFTITNAGVFGSLVGLPIINQPQVAILSVGAIEKRAVVVADQVVVRPRGYLTLGFDHRLIDGASADQFMSHVKTRLEQFDTALV
jgi:pyruvate/2-oxoglutarate dehydrogenase complex dihydrolipoamide acyltransferase (E2) component